MGSLFEKDPQVNESTSTPYQQEYYDKLLEGAAGWLEGGGMGQSESYMEDMKKLLGQAGQGYLDMATGAGQEDRYKALQDMNAASAAQSQQALGGALNSIGLGSSGTGTSNSSRRGVAEGVATAQAGTNLAAQQAAQNQNFLNQETALRQQGLAGLGGMFGQIGQLHGLAQGETAGAKQLQNLLAFQNLISGNMGGTQTGTATGGGPSMFETMLGAASTGAGIAAMSDKRLKKKIKKVKTKDGKKVKTKDGIDVAEWEWNKKAEKNYGLKGKSVGVLAQEAEEKVPSSVKKDKKGMREVDYGMLL